MVPGWGLVSEVEETDYAVVGHFDDEFLVVGELGVDGGGVEEGFEEGVALGGAGGRVLGHGGD